MFEPLFNTVLVEIDDKEAKWGKGTDDNIGGESYREGKFVKGGVLFTTPDHPLKPESIDEILRPYKGKTVMWNEGHEAGTVFENDGKKYALLYWWDLRGVKSEQ